MLRKNYELFARLKCAHEEETDLREIVGSNEDTREIAELAATTGNPMWSSLINRSAFLRKMGHPFYTFPPDSSDDERGSPHPFSHGAEGPARGKFHTAPQRILRGPLKHTVLAYPGVFDDGVVNGVDYIKHIVADDNLILETFPKDTFGIVLTAPVEKGGASPVEEEYHGFDFVARVFCPREGRFPR